MTAKSRCKRCGVTKPLDAFGKRPDLSTGRDPRCKECINEVSKETIRRGQLMRLVVDMKAWSDMKLESEATYLSDKLESVTREIDRRTIRARRETLVANPTPTPPKPLFKPPK